LSNGSIVSGDLIIAADGVHSGAVKAILGAPNPAVPTTNYNFAYRFLIPSKEIAADSETAQFAECDDGRMKFIVGDGHRLVWYPCRKYASLQIGLELSRFVSVLTRNSNEEHNFVAIFNNDEHVDHEGMIGYTRENQFTF